MGSQPASRGLRAPSVLRGMGHVVLARSDAGSRQGQPAARQCLGCCLFGLLPVPPPALSLRMITHTLQAVPEKPKERVPAARAAELIATAAYHGLGEAWIAKHPVLLMGAWVLPAGLPCPACPACAPALPACRRCCCVWEQSSVVCPRRLTPPVGFPSIMRSRLPHALPAAPGKLQLCS